MDLFEFDNVKAEKTNAMIRYHRLRKIAKLFRLFEICLALLLLSWFSTRLPTVFQISGKYFKHLCVILVSPRFVFLVGNAIVLTLFAKSGQFSGQNKSGSYLYEEFLKNSGATQKINTETPPQTTTNQTTKEKEEEEIVFHDKEVVTEYSQFPQDLKHHHHKKIHRSQSESMKPVKEANEKVTQELRRSVTVEKCRKVETPAKKVEEVMSDEELNRRIEEFIAKQVRFHKEESMAIVLQNQS